MPFETFYLIYSSIVWEDKSVYDVLKKVDIQKEEFKIQKDELLSIWGGIKWSGTSNQSLLKIPNMLRSILSPMIYVLGECGFWVIWKIVLNNLCKTDIIIIRLIAFHLKSTVKWQNKWRWSNSSGLITFEFINHDKVTFFLARTFPDFPHFPRQVKHVRLLPFDFALERERERERETQKVFSIISVT